MSLKTSRSASQTFFFFSPNLFTLSPSLSYHSSPPGHQTSKCFPSHSSLEEYCFIYLFFFLYHLSCVRRESHYCVVHTDHLVISYFMTSIDKMVQYLIQQVYYEGISPLKGMLSFSPPRVIPVLIAIVMKHLFPQRRILFVLHSANTTKLLQIITPVSSSFYQYPCPANG